MSAPSWNEEFELPDESYSLSDIQDNFEDILIIWDSYFNNDIRK